MATFKYGILGCGMIGGDPVRIMESAGQVVNHLDESYDGETPDIWDSGYVIVDFANGTRAMLELGMFAEGARFQEEISAVGPIEDEIRVDAALLSAGDHNGPTFYQHQRFVGTARGESAIEVSLEDGSWAVRMGQAAQRSAELGEAVLL
jgi:hypothetical protein